MYTSDTSSRIRGFTVMELIVGVAVVSVLVAFLLSTLSQSTAAGRGVRCQARLKSIGVAHHAYIQDHGGVLIPAGQTYLGFWYDILAPYIGGEKVTWLGAVGGTVDRVPEWLSCPSKPREIGYGWNQKMGKSVYRRGGEFETNGEVYRRLSTINRPANTVLHADSKDPGVMPDLAYENHWLYSSASWRARMATRHNGAGYYLFVDGHIEPLTPQQLIQRSEIFDPVQ